ncbi:Hsp70 family protein [Herbihabitans rhizosphaerae]|uniref:Hsp70 family protein n=1 Tax=Herbihabitans rhizosphaerae TaxID=1872711 RepID=UPI001F5F2276|nr:Hsp70 family protein [Herbihabitans rhizosphaerae]
MLQVRDDETVLVGAAAERRAGVEPECTARGLLHRVGDTVPCVLGERAYPADILVAVLITWIVGAVRESRGSDPELVMLTHPASWGAYRRGQLAGAAREAGVADIVLIPRPVATVETALAARPTRDGLFAASTVGATRAECAIVRATPGDCEVLATVEDDHGAGTHLDEVLMRHVLAGRPHVGESDRLRAACALAKERLAVHGQASVAIPEDSAPVPLSWAEFEPLVRPVAEGAVDRIRRATLAAGVRPEQLDAIALAGGSTRIPLFGALVGEAFGRPVLTDDVPAGVACRGAALAARRLLTPRTPELVTAAAHPEPSAPVAPPPPRPPVDIPGLEPPPRRRFGRRAKAVEE